MYDTCNPRSTISETGKNKRMSEYKISKCICHDRSFAEILEYARDNRYSEIEELQDDAYCGCSCGMCVPYIKCMFETGKTEFRPGSYYKRSS